MDTGLCFSAISIKEYNFCDFLFASVTKPFLKGKKIALRGHAGISLNFLCFQHFLKDIISASFHFLVK